MIAAHSPGICVNKFGTSGLKVVGRRDSCEKTLFTRGGGTRPVIGAVNSVKVTCHSNVNVGLE